MKKYRLISETIDGSIKNIIQLKTLDNSLEFSQMFDALCDTPKTFQSKLVQCLNSLGQTMKCQPLDTFNLVLCGNSEDDSRKKLYTWWGNVFEILSKCEIPKDREEEFNKKVDELFAEVLKQGSSSSDEVESGDEEVVTEEYEHASKEEEDKMLKEMKFAIGKIGEIANRVQDLINFVNPYCESTYEESIEMKNINRYEDGIDRLRREYVIGHIGDSTVKDEVSQISFFSIGEKGRFLSEMRHTREQYDQICMDCCDKGDGTDLVKFLVDKEIFSSVTDAEDYVSDELDLYVAPRYSNNFKVGDRVYWNDPDDGISSGEYTIFGIEHSDDDGDGIEYVLSLKSDDGSEVEALEDEVEPINFREISEKSDGEWVSMEDLGVKTEDNDDKEKKFKIDGKSKTLIADDQQKVNEMTIEQEITSCDQLHNLLWGQGKKNLEELLRSGIASDETILGVLEDANIKNLTSLNDLLAFDFEQVLEWLGADIEKYNNYLEIVKAD